jgi:hypothetical protein
VKQEKIEAAFWSVINSEAFEQRIGAIVQKVVNAKLDREVTLETFEQQMGGKVVKTEKMNLLDVVAITLPKMEGAIRGCQADSAEARNRAAQVRDMLAGLMRLLPPDGELIDATPPPRLTDSGNFSPLHRTEVSANG